MAIITHEGNPAVSLPDLGLFQPFNPDTMLPFTQIEAAAFEAAALSQHATVVASAEAAQAAAAAQQLADGRAGCIRRIKEEAAERITALDWRVQRANEHIALGVVGAQAELTAVYQSREDIRTASTAAEAAVALLGTVEEIRAFAW